MDISRLSKLKKLLKKNNLDAALISSPSNIYYLTEFDYFSYIDRDAFLLITKNNNYILTNLLYSLAVKKTLKNFILCEISSITSFTKHLEQIIKKEKITLLGIEENNITVAEYKKILSIIKTLQPIDLRILRIIKSPDEIKRIKKACTIGDKALTSLLENIKPGISEKELALQLETLFRHFGGEPSFPSIVAFGENAAVPHHKASDVKLKNNEIILIDSGVKYKEYCSDMTRTIFFGKATLEQKKVYQIVLEAQKKAINFLNHQLVNNTDKLIKSADIDRVSREYIINQGFDSIPHGLGHGIGLQLHEPPTLSPRWEDKITEGMVFSIEPGIYLNDKFGVRIEDLFTIQNNKLIQLTKSPRKILEIGVN